MSVVARKGDGFLLSPFQDSVFERLAAHHGYEEDDRTWSAAAVGDRASDVAEYPAGMPRFTFTRGTEDYDGGMTIQLVGNARDGISYVHTALSHPHLVMRRDALPETVWTALAGRPVSDLVDHPALAGMTIVAEQSRTTPDGLAVYSDVRIEDA